MRKGWKYTVYSRFRGRFYGKFPGGDKFHDAYQKKKDDYVRQVKKEGTPAEKISLREQYFYVLLTKIIFKEKLTENQAVEMLNDVLGMDCNAEMGEHYKWPLNW